MSGLLVGCAEIWVGVEPEAVEAEGAGAALGLSLAVVNGLDSPGARA